MKPYEAPEIQEKLSVIKESVLSVVPNTEAIYLFGSYAYGTPHKDSDLDVYVVVPDSEQRRQLDLEVAVFNVLTYKFRFRFPLDLMVQYAGVFHESGEKPTVAGIVKRSGVKLYG